MTGALEEYLRLQERKKDPLYQVKELFKVLRDCYHGDAKHLEPTWAAILGPVSKTFPEGPSHHKTQFCEQLYGNTIQCPDFSKLLLSLRSGWKNEETR